MFDIIVVGGNLAGINAAINAAERDVSVAVIEKNKEPLHPARCGEGTDSVTWRLIEDTGCSKNEIKRIKINISSYWSTSFLLNQLRLYIFDRNCVERKLLEKAESLGVRLFLGRAMRDFLPPHDIILDDNERIQGRVIIDGSGFSCQIGRRIGIAPSLKSKDIGVCIQVRVEGSFPSDTIYLWFHTPFAPFGYAWMFPINSHLANIGIGIPGGQNIDMKESLYRYIREVAGNDSKILYTFYATIPSALPLHRLVKDNVMIVGDAARLANPIFGKGISNAIISGSLAGRVAAKYIHGEISSLDLYQQFMYKKVVLLRRFYHRKVRSMYSEKVFLSKYKHAFSLLKYFHDILPSFSERRIVKALEKDISVLEEFV